MNNNNRAYHSSLVFLISVLQLYSKSSFSQEQKMDKLLSDSREDALMYTFENILDVNLVYIFEEDGLVLCSYDNTVIYVAEWRGF